MIDTKINQMIIDKVEETDAPQHIKDFLLDVLRHERSVYDQYETGGMPRYSRTYLNLLNKYVRDHKKYQQSEAEDENTLP